MEKDEKKVATTRQRLESSAARGQKRADAAGKKADEIKTPLLDHVPGTLNIGMTSPSGSPGLRREFKRVERQASLRKDAAEEGQKAKASERQTSRSVYKDDTDLAERLETRISERETDRDRLKGANTGLSKLLKGDRDEITK